MHSLPTASGSKLSHENASEWDRLGPREHRVQFYDTDDFLVDAIVSYVKAGLAANETVLVIATAEHWQSAKAKLAAGSDAVARAEAAEQLIARDAAAMLELFMVGETPDASRFQATVGEIVRTCRKTGRRLRAFGEMVALLWDSGNRAGAVALEELWNQLLREHEFALFCAYRITQFRGQGDDSKFAEICKCHTQVIPAESYLQAGDAEQRGRMISELQQKAQMLEAEIARRKLIEEALRAREHELADFVENAIEGLHQVDAHGTIVWANRAELEMLGYRKEEYVGRPIREFHVDAEVIEAMLAKLMRGEALYDCPARLRCKDGSIKHVLVHSSGYFENGRFAHSRCFTRDVTAHKLLQEQQQRQLEAEREALAEAKRVSRLKDEFLATLSHELRTPLNAILGWTELIKEAADDPNTIAEGIGVIERNVRMQAQLIEDLLDMSRIAAGKIGLDIRLVELAPILQAAVDAVRPSADAKKITIDVMIDPSVGPVRGDARRLQQVIWNLLTNAIKFTGDGGQVVLAVDRLSSEIEITVSDNGRGIDPDFLPFLFERFRQEDSSTTRKHGGLGIGLSIVKQLIELHGGSICAKSAGLAQGAKFIITLPIPAGSSDNGPERQGLAVGDLNEKQPLADLGGARILVVDDDSDARDLMARTLGRHGADVATAGSVAAALSVFDQRPPEVLVSDIGMPDADGYALIRQVRQRTRTQGGAVKAIALTAFARSEDRVKALRAGYQLHLAKPIEPKELAVAIAMLLRSPHRSSALMQ